MYKVTSRWPHQDSIKIEWNLTKRCNYDCSYCPSEIHDNFSKPTDIDILTKTLDKLKTLGKPIRLSFTGGEPTVHPRFEKLLNYAKQLDINWISVTTNGTRKASWYASQKVNQYVISLHFEYNFQRILNTILALKQSTNISILVHVMAHHKKMKDVKSVVDVLNEHQIDYAVRRIRWVNGDRDIFDDMRYQNDDLEWIKDHEATIKGNCIIDNEKIMHSNDIIKLHLNQYKNWQCNAGIESLMINWDGNVFRATCRVGGSLGNIYLGTFDLPKTSIICDRNHCTCAADIPLTKVRL